MSKFAAVFLAFLVYTTGIFASDVVELTPRLITRGAETVLALAFGEETERYIDQHNTDGITALMLSAALGNRYEMIKILVAALADPFIQAKSSYCPIPDRECRAIDMAAKHGDNKVVDLLWKYEGCFLLLREDLGKPMSDIFLEKIIPCAKELASSHDFSIP